MSESFGYIPLGDQILAKPEEVINQTKSGLIMRVGKDLELEQGGQTKAEIIAIGSEAFRGWPLKPQVGDKIILSKYAGQIVYDDNDEEYRVCSDFDVKMLKVNSK